MYEHSKEVEKATGKKPKPFGIYDLKGKGATDMYLDDVPLEKIQRLCDHASITTTEIYIKARLVRPIMANKVVMKV
jgi:integrase